MPRGRVQTTAAERLAAVERTLVADALRWAETERRRRGALGTSVALTAGDDALAAQETVLHTAAAVQRAEYAVAQETRRLASGDAKGAPR